MNRASASGSCGYCGRYLKLRGDGTLRRHRPKCEPGRQPACPGSYLTYDAGNKLRNERAAVAAGRRSA